MKNVLVTGGAGFIGSNFVRYLLAARPNLQVFNLDALTYAGSLENLKELPDQDRYQFIQGDIGDFDMVQRLLSEMEIDTVVHFAAETHVDRSILGPAPFIQTNITGTFNLLEAARHAWLGKLEGKRFQHVSTDEVYGSLDPLAPPSTESSNYGPRSPYSASKAGSDHIARAYHHTYGLPVTITNSSNNYGPHQFPEKLIPLTILNALQMKPLPVYGDGKQVRDWLYVDDHIEALLLVLERGQVGQTYNIGGRNQSQNIEVVNQICRILDELRPAKQLYSSLIEYVPDRPGHDRRYAMNISKINTELGWEPRHDLKSGLRETVQWYLENPTWIKSISDQQTFNQWMADNYKDRS
jgi:dTDP-glucose 4,6-dehydratase